VVVELGGLAAHVLAEGREEVRSEPLLASSTGELLALLLGEVGGPVGL
jgi:hypothetical protein